MAGGLRKAVGADGGRRRVGVRRYDAADDPRCGAPCADWLGVEAHRTCVDGECAAHVTLVTDRRFAALAVARIACFVEQRLGPGATAREDCPESGVEI